MNKGFSTVGLVVAIALSLVTGTALGYAGREPIKKMVKGKTTQEEIDEAVDQELEKQKLGQSKFQLEGITKNVDVGSKVITVQITASSNSLVDLRGSEVSVRVDDETKISFGSSKDLELSDVPINSKVHIGGEINQESPVEDGDSGTVESAETGEDDDQSSDDSKDSSADEKGTESEDEQESEDPDDDSDESEDTDESEDSVESEIEDSTETTIIARTIVIQKENADNGGAKDKKFVVGATVKEVGGDSLTLTILSSNATAKGQIGEDITIVVTDSTIIEKNNSSISLSDINANDKVTIAGILSGETFTASKITVREPKGQEKATSSSNQGNSSKGKNRD